MAQSLEATSDWGPLPSDTSRSSVFLFKFSHDAHGYQILVTDCVRIWKETLSKSEIVRKAQQTECSIDPAHDSSQLAVFYEKLHDALSSRAGSRLVADQRADDQVLTLRASCELPKPFAVFQWSLELRPQSLDDFRALVFMPLTRKCLAQQNQIDDLVALLAEKDDAIAKILDKIETAGLDPTSIFPTAARAKAKTRVGPRAQLLQHVKGLRRFNRQHWTASSVSESLSASPELLLETALHGISSYQDGSARFFQTSFPEQSGADMTQNQSASGVDCSLGSDAYQRQATPPNLKTVRDGTAANKFHSTAQTRPPSGDETTDDESFRDQLSDNERASQPPALPKAATAGPESPRATSATPGGLKRLGIIRAQHVSRREPEEAHVHHDTPSQPASSSTSTPDVPPPQRRRLGVVGGRSLPRPLRASDSHLDTQGHHTARTQGEMSHLPALSDESKPAVGEASKKPVTDKEGSAVDVPISDEQRADQKREELKRLLETRNTVPSKKKRRF